MDTQQFEVIRPKCAGLDVHKKSVVAAVCTSDPVTLTASYKTKVLLIIIIWFISFRNKIYTLFALQLLYN